jgi:hypothetical protein
MRHVSRGALKRQRPLLADDCSSSQCPAPLYSSPKFSSLLRSNIKVIVASMILKVRAVPPAFLVQPLLDSRQQLLQPRETLPRQFVCQLLVGFMKQLHCERQDGESERTDAPQLFGEVFQPPASLSPHIPAREFVLCALLCAAPTPYGFQSLLKFNQESAELNLRDPRTRLRLTSCLLTLYGMQPNGRTFWEMFPTIEKKSELTDFCKRVCTLLLRRNAGDDPDDDLLAGEAEGRETGPRREACLAALVKAALPAVRGSSASAGGCNIAPAGLQAVDLLSVVHVLIISLLVTNRPSAANVVALRCAVHGELLPTAVLFSMNLFRKKEARDLMVSMFLRLCRSQARLLNSTAPATPASMQLVLAALALMGSQETTTTTELLQSLTAMMQVVDVEFMLRAHSQSGLWRPVSDGECMPMLEWNDEMLRRLLELVHDAVRASPRSEALEELRDAAVAFFVRLVLALSPAPSRKPAAHANLRLGVAQVTKPQSAPPSRGVCLSRRIPHDAVAKLVSHLLNVGELYAAATALVALQSAGNVVLSHYNAALLSKAASAAKLAGLPHHGIVALVSQRKLVFGPDMLEPELMIRESADASAGDRNALLYGNVCCGSVFTRWQSFSFGAM